MNKTLSKSKNKIVGGNKFIFSNYTSNDNKISFEAKKDNNEVKLTFFSKKGEKLKIENSDINIEKNLKIITSNISTVNYYEKGEEYNEQFIADNIINFDTCLIVDFNNIYYIFLNVNTSGNKSIKDFEDKHKNLNLKRLDALMIIRFKQLGLDINFVNKFMAAVKGYVDGQKEGKKLSSTTSGGKKMSNYKILNNLILKLNKINNIKKSTKPTKPKATKPKATKPKDNKPKATKPTKPKATKSKAIKKI